MCRRITCSVCAKPSFAGCGLHIESVLGDIPPAERCRCGELAEAGARPANAGEKTGEKTGDLTAALTGALASSVRRIRGFLGFPRSDRGGRP